MVVGRGTGNTLRPSPSVLTQEAWLLHPSPALIPVVLGLSCPVDGRRLSIYRVVKGVGVVGVNGRKLERFNISSSTYT